MEPYTYLVEDLWLVSDRLRSWSIWLNNGVLGCFRMKAGWSVTGREEVSKVGIWLRSAIGAGREVSRCYRCR